MNIAERSRFALRRCRRCQTGFSVLGDNIVRQSSMLIRRPTIEHVHSFAGWEQLALRIWLRQARSCGRRRGGDGGDARKGIPYAAILQLCTDGAGTR